MTIRQALPAEATAEHLARLLPQLAELGATRRGLLLAPLFAALPLSLSGGRAAAIDPAQTQVTLRDQYQWRPALPGGRRTRSRPCRCSVPPTDPGNMSC